MDFNGGCLKGDLTSGQSVLNLH
uniref:Uncharacterized protein n=1 Tax=Tetranychus urticae TaxID=32264 RepID=T1K7Y8_TETUR